MWGIAIAGFILCLALGKSLVVPSDQLLLTALSGIAGGIGSQTFYLLSHRHLPISILNSVLAVSPFFIAITAYFAFGQIPSGYKLGGGAVVLVGVFLIAFPSRKKAVEVEPPFE